MYDLALAMDLLRSKDLAAIRDAATNPENQLYSALHVNHLFDEYLRSEFLDLSVFCLLLNYVVTKPNIYHLLIDLADIRFLHVYCKHKNRNCYIDGMRYQSYTAPLAYACEKENIMAVAVLLRSGAKLECRTKSRDPLMFHLSSYATPMFFARVVPMLTKAFGASILDQQDKYGCTALHYCYKTWTPYTIEMGKILIANGALTNIPDKRGFTALHYYQQGPMLSCYHHS